MTEKKKVIVIRVYIKNVIIIVQTVHLQQGGGVALNGEAIELPLDPNNDISIYEMPNYIVCNPIKVISNI